MTCRESAAPVIFCCYPTAATFDRYFFPLPILNLKLKTPLKNERKLVLGSWGLVWLKEGGAKERFFFLGFFNSILFCLEVWQWLWGEEGGGRLVYW